MFQAVDDDGLGQAFPGVNASDRTYDWKQNYREPDVAIFHEATTARDMSTHWLGGPDFAIEILSEGDRAREKLDFYAKVNVRELLIVDRAPWQLELYRLARRRLGLVGRSTSAAGEPLACRILPEVRPWDWLSRTLRDGHGYNEESTYVQKHLDVPNGVLACRCPRCFPTRPASRSRMS